MNVIRTCLLIVLCAGLLDARQLPTGKNAGEPGSPGETVEAYSIAAWDSGTGDLGIAVESGFLAAGAVVPYAKANVGAFVTQAHANAEFGALGLAMLARGMSARQVIEDLIRDDSGASRRQLGAVDARGNAFAYTGSACGQYAGQIIGSNYTVQGNALAGDGVVKAVAHTFELTPGDLADRLIAALEAGERAGGRRSRNQSAALLVVRERGGYSGSNDRLIDIRVDQDSLPLVELKRIYSKWDETFLFDARMRTIDEFNREKKFAAAQAEMQRAIQGFNEQLRVHPDDPDVLTHIAWILATNDLDRERALLLAKRAATLAPGRSQMLATVAECHYRLGHYEEAIAIETELVAREPANDEYWRQLQKFKDAKQKAGR